MSPLSSYSYLHPPEEKQMPFAPISIVAGGTGTCRDHVPSFQLLSWDKVLLLAPTTRRIIAIAAGGTGACKVRTCPLLPAAVLGHTVPLYLLLLYTIFYYITLSILYIFASTARRIVVIAASGIATCMVHVPSCQLLTWDIGPSYLHPPQEE